MTDNCAGNNPSKQQMQAFLSIFGDEEGSQSYQRAKKEKAKKSKTQ